MQIADNFQCDAAKPACGQCRRAGRKCSGYRDLKELRLVDQSFEVSSKLSKSSKKRGADVHQYGDSASPSSDSSTSEETTELSLVSSSFPEPIFWMEANARGAFFEQYIDISRLRLKTELGFVTPLYDNARREGMLESIISALGLAVLLKGQHDPSLQMMASAKYSSALRQTHLALQSPKAARSDETLATVLLLALHESIAVDSLNVDANGVSIHTQGAIKLLQLRGKTQHRTMYGARMFHRLYAEVLLSCLYSRTRIPPGLLRLQRAVAPALNSGETAAAAVFEIAAKLCDIQAAADPVEAVDIACTFHALSAIDYELDRWPLALDLHLYVGSQPVDNPDKSFLTHQDVYINHLAGAAWNRYRCVKIRTSEILLNLLETHPDLLEDIGVDVAQRSQQASASIMEMSKQICQSVPYFLGNGSVHDWQEERKETPTMYGGAAMLMPLYFASNPERISPAMHQWLMQQVARIGKDTGIAKARAILVERGGVPC